jgi:hypothetical protein
MKYVIILMLAFSAFAFADSYNEVANKDTWVWPGNGPYGSSTEVRTNRFPDYSQFGLFEWDIASIPVGSTINSADFNVYCYDGMYGVNHELFRITESWNEATVVDDIAHDNGTTYDEQNVTGAAWYVFDVEDLVQEWVDETYDNYGLVFYGTSGTGFFIRWYSRENASSQPYLEIDYDEPVGIESESLGGIKAIFN